MATVRFYLRRPKANGKLKTTEVSIYLKANVGDNRFELNTCEKIPPVHWNFRTQEAKASYTGHIELNESLSNIKRDILQVWRDNKSADVETIKSLCEPILKYGSDTAPDRKSLFPLLKEFIDISREEKDEKTVKTYKALEKKLLAFNPKLAIDGTDNRFYDAFKEHLYKQGLFDSTVFKYFTRLSTFLTWAYARGHEVHQTNNRLTHKSWKHPKRVYEPITLTLAEIERLEMLQITDELITEKLPPQKHGHRGERTVKALTTARDIFIFECRTCQRISDLKKFDLRDVVDNVWVNPVTKGRRLNARKTRIPFNTRFTAPAWTILQKYGFRIPEFTEQKVNENIKTVCMLAGIDQEIMKGRWKRNKYIVESGPKYKFISTHTARKTFITLALQFMQPKLVKDIARVSWNTLRHYEGHSEDTALIDGLNSIPSTTNMKIA